jgi:hypothetical protein
MLWLLAVGAIVIGLFLLLETPGPHDQLRGRLRPVLGLAWLAFGGMMALMSRAGVLVVADGIVVQGAIRRRHWRWEEVKAFELAPAIYAPVLRIDLVGGAHVRAPGFKSRSREEQALARERVAALNHRAAGSNG